MIVALERMTPSLSGAVLLSAENREQLWIPRYIIAVGICAVCDVETEGMRDSSQDTVYAQRRTGRNS